MPPAKTAESAGALTIVGYILPEKKASRVDHEAEESEDEEEEEEKQPEFLDMAEMSSVSSGGQMFECSAPRRNTVDFQVLSGAIHQVEGRFALRSPWWEVTCAVRRHNSKLVVKGFPSYKLRSDLDREGWHQMVSLFLSALSALHTGPEVLREFFEWLPKNADVSISNLMEVLAECSEEQKYEGVARHITAAVLKSVAWKQVCISRLYPNVMRYLPTLLPGPFVDLLGKEKKIRKVLPATQATQARLAALPTEQEGDEEEKDDEAVVLDKLEDIIRNDVWKLGFNYLVYKEVNLVRCEAQLKAFMDCNLLHKIPELQRNALHVYEQLKKTCHSTGSTYVELNSLCTVLCQKMIMPDEQAWNAIDFLVKQGVVVRDNQKLALQNFREYETGIATCLLTLAAHDPWKIPLDAREVLRADDEKRLMFESEQETTRHDENADFESNPTVPDPTNTSVPDPTNTSVPDPTNTSVPDPTNTSVPDPTNTSVPDPTNTSVPDPTNTSVPLAHGEEIPLIQPEDNNHPVSSSDSSDGPGQAAADQVLPPVELELDLDQVRAVEMICANPVTVISGKGGCGKTTVVCRVFKAALHQSRCDQEIKDALLDFENDTGGPPEWDYLPGSPGLVPQPEDKDCEEKQQDGSRPLTSREEILLTAPTGRAASLLSKKTNFKAYTLHQVLYSFMTTEKEEGKPIDWKFQHVRVFVVDEGSLVCVQLLHSILTMLIRHAELRKFILLGDIRQLPSIQPGNTLHDLFHSLKGRQYAIEMMTNHRAESQLIVDNASRISDMGMKKRRLGPLDFDATVDLNESCSMPSADSKFILVRLPTQRSDDDLQTAVKLLIDKAPGLQEDLKSQFIAFKRADVALINELCCKHYNNHTTKNHRNKLLFRPGDKVCCTKNGYIHVEEEVGGESGEEGEARCDLVQSSTNHQRLIMKEESSINHQQSGIMKEEESSTNQQRQIMKEDREKEKVRLCNGEIFFIKAVEDKFDHRGKKSKTLVTLDDKDGHVLTAEYRELQRQCRLQHAWARTIHTFQGSENDTIVYVLQDGSAQTWKHVYTAVTRGKKRVYVVAYDKGIEDAIKKRITPRNTRLEALVRGGLKDSLPSCSQIQPNTPQKTPSCFRPPPSPSLSSQPPSRSRSTPLLPKRLWKAEEDKEDITDSLLLDDLAFSQAYPWDSFGEGEVKENQPHSAVASPSSKRAISVEGVDSAESPAKQLRIMSITD